MLHEVLVGLVWMAVQAGGNPDCQSVSLHHGQSVKSGNRVIFSCHPGFKLQGDRVVKCVRGEIMGRVPTCVRSSHLSETTKKLGRKSRKDSKGHHHHHHQKLEARHKNKQRRSKKFRLAGMQADQPPGIVRPYVDDIVGHEDDLVLLDGHSSEGDRYETDYYYELEGDHRDNAYYDYDYDPGTETNYDYDEGSSYTYDNDDSYYEEDYSEYKDDNHEDESEKELDSPEPDETTINIEEEKVAEQTDETERDVFTESSPTHHKQHEMDNELIDSLDEGSGYYDSDDEDLVEQIHPIEKTSTTVESVESETTTQSAKVDIATEAQSSTTEVTHTTIEYDDSDYNDEYLEYNDSDYEHREDSKMSEVDNGSDSESDEYEEDYQYSYEENSHSEGDKENGEDYQYSYEEYSESENDDNVDSLATENHSIPVSDNDNRYNDEEKSEHTEETGEDIFVDEDENNVANSWNYTTDDEDLSEGSGEDDESISTGSSTQRAVGSSTAITMPTTTSTTTRTTSWTVTSIVTQELPSSTDLNFNSEDTFDDEDLYIEMSGDRDSVEGSGGDLYTVDQTSVYKEDITDIDDPEPLIPTADDIATTSEAPDELTEAGSKFRQDFFLLHGIDVISLDTTCMEDFVSAPKIQNAKVKGYDGQEESIELPGRKYAVVSYHCEEGYELAEPRIQSLYCSESRWVGNLPQCRRSRGELGEENQCQGVGSCEQLCVLEDGKPVCSCHEGFSLHTDGETCVDMDECLINNANCSQICINRPGTYICECESGFSVLEQGECEDINECLLNNGHGPCQDSCRNTEGGYECSCENLPGTVLGEDHHTCKSAAGCNVNNGGCSHSCIDSYNQVFCMCPSGYVLGPDWKTCEDVDECEAGDLDCPQVCVNTPGSAHCGCHPGFQLTGTTCTDIDECSVDHACQHTCLNTEGSYTCSCTSGFELQDDGRSCMDVDECQLDNGGCDQICINREGGRDCACQSGYRMEGGDCVDVDECSNILDICEHGECINTQGSYTCTCHQGFHEEGGSCVDVDECQDQPCGDHGACSNLLGGFECRCQPGYSFDGSSCVDLDECKIGNPCVFGLCSNLQGGYKCDCSPGYFEVEGTCLDVDECLHSPCGVGQCVNTPGSYECSCPSGYVHRDGGCHDVDECVSSPCGRHGDCANLPGSYHCTCHPGFEMESGACEDVNECERNPCSGGSCTNLLGSFECSCSTGFLLDEFTNSCVDVNECLQGNGGCEHTCINTLGSRTCTCKSGFNVHPEDGNRCEDVDECSLNNGGCQHTCVNEEGSHSCRCDDGYSLQGGRCVDNDECAHNNGGCEQECLNTAGGHECACVKGFLSHPRNRSVCVDVDECTERNGGCQQICRNLPGSVRCECRQGFQLLPDGLQCGDLNECTKENGGCSHGCTNLEGGHICFCPRGWSLGPDERTCKEKAKTMCPAKQRPRFGFFRCTKRRTAAGYEAGTRCLMKCRKGYTTDSPARIKCMEDSSWVGSSGHCRPMDCPPLNQIQNGTVHPASCTAGSSRLKHRCKFTCDSGFKLNGSMYARCGLHGEWKYPGDQPSCQSDFPPPFIMCPPDQTKPLPQGSSSVYVMFPQPKTNVDWFRYVESSPAWAKQLEGEMNLGRHTLEFRAFSPFSNKTASCQMVVHVKDTEPPKVTSCPQSFVDYLHRGQRMKRVHWKEPVFSDNVAIQHVMASFLPGHYFTEGRHHVLYQAADADGNRARCGFTITIKKRPVFNYQPGPATSYPPGTNSNQLPPPMALPTHRIPAQCSKVPQVPNGRMACIDRSISKKCTPVCDVGHVFYQKFNYRPPTYLCSNRRIDWQINRFIPDCSPVEKMKAPGLCAPGWEVRDSLCIGCPPGMYRDEGQLCKLCAKGTYAEKFGSQECTPCPPRTHTSSLGSRSQSDCGKGHLKSPNRRRGHSGRGRGKMGLLHYNSWLNEEPYSSSSSRERRM